MCGPREPLQGSAPVWGLSVDFSKLFNSLSLEVVLAIAGFMGLGSDVIQLLRVPLKKIVGHIE